MGIRTKNFNLTQINIAADSIANGSDNYYVFAGHPFYWPDDNNPPAVFESQNDIDYNTKFFLSFGKKLGEDNLRMMAKRHDWKTNTTYAQFSNFDNDLYNKKFYVLTDENKCYKVLYNNLSTPSIVKPSLTQNNAFQTSDGYIWKYMFTVSNPDMDRFSTPTYFPVSESANTVSSATTGIDVIDMISTGKGYVCYVTGSVQSIVSDKIVQIDNYASQYNDFYTLSSFYVTDGPSEGQLRNVAKYVSNTSGNFVYLDESIAVVPQLSKYRIAPGIHVIGDGEGCKAICDVSENYGIKNVKIISSGSGYSRAKVKVSSNTSYGEGATFNVYVAPPGGHGSYPSYELGVDTFCLSTVFNKSEDNTIPTDMSFRRYGILKNPTKFDKTEYDANTFSNVMSISTSPFLVFDHGELVKSEDERSEAYVLSSNSSVTRLVGDKTFEINDILIAANGVKTTLNDIYTKGDIDPTSAKILYLNNSTPVPRSNTGFDTVKILITF